jgi:hypothetical protein
MSTNTKIYAVNKTDTHLLFKQGFLRIDREGYRAMSEDDLKHTDVLNAIDREFVEITDVKPKDTIPKGGVIPITSASTYHGMTADELKASRNVPKPPGATSTPLGRSNEPESVVEADGDANESDEAKTTRRGRKAAADKPTE